MIYKDCDIRGVYGEELRLEEVRLIGRALGTMLEGRSIAVCGDVRTSTPDIKRELIAGLLETGGDIIAVPADLEMNGEKQDVDYSDYAIRVSAGRSAFAIVMLPNYTIDQETYATEKFEVTDWHLDFIIHEAAS